MKGATSDDLPVKQLELASTQNGITVFPNPASDGRVTLRTINGDAIERATLFASTGAIVRQEQPAAPQLQWTLEGLAPGFYLVRLEHGGVAETARLLIQ